MFADVERNCRQGLATQVLEYRPLRDAVIFRTPDAVWRLSYPKP